MKFYLSSYKVGNASMRLRGLFTNTVRIGYIPNALDFSSIDLQQRDAHIQDDLNELTSLGLQPEILDLKEYFTNKPALEKKLQTLNGLWVSGGNVFILRQAMFLSGLDEILCEDRVSPDFVYGGYSAAGCVLSASLEAYQIVDDATETPYKKNCKKFYGMA